MTKIPLFFEPASPLPDDIDAWAERVAEQIEAALTAIEAKDDPLATRPTRPEP